MDGGLIIAGITNHYGAGNSDKNTLMEAEERLTCNFYINGDRFSDKFTVIENFSDAVIIGAATMQKWRFKIDFENDLILYDPEVTKLQII